MTKLSMLVWPLIYLELRRIVPSRLVEASRPDHTQKRKGSHYMTSRVDRQLSEIEAHAIHRSFAQAAWTGAGAASLFCTILTGRTGMTMLLVRPLTGGNT